MGGLLHLVQRGGAWGWGPAQSAPRCTKYNSGLLTYIWYSEEGPRGAQDVNKGLYFRSDKSKSHGNFTVYDINRLKEFLGQDICSQLLFIHAVTGCDSTSRIFGVGKKNAFRKLLKGDSVLRVLCQRIHPTEPDNGCY